MAKIKNAEGKAMSVVEVCALLGHKMNSAQAKVFAMGLTDENADMPAKRRFAHMVLDVYRLLPSVSDDDMEIKKLANHLMTRYQKSMVSMTGEEEVAFNTLFDDIKNKAE